MNMGVSGFISSLIVLVGMIMYISNSKHFLMMLLSIEYMVLGLFMVLSVLLNHFNSELWVLLFFLTMSVCEGSLGLAILVSLIRTHGNDHFQSINLLGW